MSAYDQDIAAFRDQPISQLLVKVASRCNIDCDYCYWFRDAAVYNKPKLMSAEVLQQLLQRIEEHIVAHSLIDLPIILHGGEPLLWGVENFRRIAEACEAISARTECDIPIAVTTNGVLIDDEWLDCFESHNISVAISMGLLELAARSIPMGTAYAVWGGIGAVGTVLVGILWFAEPASMIRISLIFVIVAAIAGLKLAA